MPERLKGRKVYTPNPRDMSPSPAKRERVGERDEKEPK
jgi:hypothetical protein